MNLENNQVRYSNKYGKEQNDIINFQVNYKKQGLLPEPSKAKHNHKININIVRK